MRADRGRPQALTLFTAVRAVPATLRCGPTAHAAAAGARVARGAGPEQEVFFEQTAVPGSEAALDFAEGRELAVTIAGEPFAHRRFEWVLSFSGWTSTELAPTESFEALVSGLQGAAWTLGVPQVVRHDSLPGHPYAACTR
jgi:hypothetical protein